jgi:hypothetical protein
MESQEPGVVGVMAEVIDHYRHAHGGVTALWRSYFRNRGWWSALEHRTTLITYDGRSLAHLIITVFGGVGVSPKNFLLGS